MSVILMQNQILPWAIFFNQTGQYDAIIGNPPFNFSVKIKTPTTSNVVKKNDGFTVC